MGCVTELPSCRILDVNPGASVRGTKLTLIILNITLILPSILCVFRNSILTRPILISGCG